MEVSLSSLTSTCSLVLIVIVLLNYRDPLRYYFKFIFYIGFVSSIALLTLPYGLLKPRDVRNANLPTRICRVVSPLLGVRWVLEGTQHLKEDRAAIIVSNHQSMLDFLGMCEVWDTALKVTAVAKREIMFCGPFGLVAWLCGLIFIDRTNPVESKSLVSEAGKEILDKKIKLWIYAEGTRGADVSNFLPFKKGAFHLALQSRIPIIPVVIQPYNAFVDHKQKYFSSGSVRLKVLPPVFTTDYAFDDVAKLSDDVREMMLVEYRSMKAV